MTVTMPISIPHQDHSQEQAMFGSHPSMMHATTASSEFYPASFSSSFTLKPDMSHMMTPQMPMSNPIAIQSQRTLSSNVADANPLFHHSFQPYGSMPDSPLEHLISPTSEEFMMDNYHQSRRFSVSSAEPGTPFMHPGHSRSNSYFEGQMVGDSSNWAMLQQQMAQQYSMSLPNTFDSPSSSQLPHSDPSTSPTFNPSSAKSPNSHDHTNGMPKAETEMDKLKLQQIIDKKKRRRENHNAVERRRRDIINEKIQELSTLLPQGLIPSNKCNKGAILRQSVDYIRYLHSLLYQQNINPAQLLMAHHANQGMPLESIVEGQCLELNHEASTPLPVDAQLVSLQQ